MSDVPVQVMVRIKPSSNPFDIITRKDSVSIPNPRNQNEHITYSFNSVFPSTTTQDDIWQECQSTVLESLHGRNVTIFAYGQTGSGKTHTMNENGLIQHSIQALLQAKASLCASYIEVRSQLC
jgi:Cdc6-like AAA superfamily ATPase